MLHCNRIDPFVSLMGNFNWGPISRNDIVSSLLIAVSRMDGLMTCCFTTFSTVFQSYQDDECVIMKGCVQCNPVYN